MSGSYSPEHSERPGSPSENSRATERRETQRSAEARERGFDACRSSIRISVEPGDDESDVVLEILGGRESADVAENRVVDRVQLRIAVGLQQPGHAIDGVKLAGVRAPIREAVGVDEESVARNDLQGALVVCHVRDGPEEGAGIFEKNDLALLALKQQKTGMRRVGVRQDPLRIEAKELCGGELRRQADAEKKVVQAGHQIGKPCVRVDLRVDVALEQ